MARWSSIGLVAAAASSPKRTASCSVTASVSQSTRRRGVRFRVGGAHDRRGDRTEGEANRASRSVDGEAGAGDGDDHRVADADLGVALPAVEHRHRDGDDQLAGTQGRALDPGHELEHRQACACRRVRAARRPHRARRAPAARRRRANTWRGCRRSSPRCGSAASRPCAPPEPAPARSRPAVPARARRTSRRHRAAPSGRPDRGPSVRSSGS